MQLTTPTKRADDGFVLVWFALLLTLFMGMAAFSVDIGHWYYVRNREQKAADAAALAAAVHWPGDKTAGRAEAVAVARRNGFEASEVTVEDFGGARVKVTITRDVKNFFGSFLGVETTRIRRWAVGEYQASIPLGSPANTFGDEPVQSGEERWSNLYSDQGDQPQFWTNVFGPRSVKVNGDAHQAKVCAGAMNCVGQSTNLDYRDSGYTYVVRVGNAPANANRLAIEVFDPAFVHVGDLCDQNMAGAPSQGSPNRYASGSASPFCTGDQLFTGSGQDGVPPTTTYLLRGPDNTPWDHLDNPVLTSGDCNSNRRQFAGRNQAVSTLLASNPVEASATAPGGGQVRFADHFRKWFRLCQISSSLVLQGDYIVQVRTNLALGNPATAPIALDQGSGANRFSMRAAWLKNGNANPDSTGISMFAADSMSLYANDVGADTEFFLTRILPGAAGRTLHLKFFDTGDASQPGNLQILPPRTGGDSGGVFTGCTVSRPRGNAVTGTGPSCTVHGLSSVIDNGDWIDVFVPIPADYTCNFGNSLGCWLQVKFHYNVPGTVVNDTTTWAAELIGDPVRLVE